MDCGLLFLAGGAALSYLRPWRALYAIGGNKKRAGRGHTRDRTVWVS